MSLCSKLFQFGLMSEPRPCLRLFNHNGYHTPDLTGLKFGRAEVLRQTTKAGPNKCVRWIVSIDGVEASVEARSLISGSNKGKRLHQHGFRNTPEYGSVMNHYGAIFRKANPAHKYYNEMPFYDDWNPQKGGELWKGAQWVIQNLGSKPGPKWTLDIIEHIKGFVPGNLRWAKKGVQMRNQLHRLLEGISDEEFAVEARKRGYAKVTQ